LNDSQVNLDDVILEESSVESDMM